jgi:hypothetical protein
VVEHRTGTTTLVDVERLNFNGWVYEVADLNQKPFLKALGV